MGARIWTASREQILKGLNGTLKDARSSLQAFNVCYREAGKVEQQKLAPLRAQYVKNLNDLEVNLKLLQAPSVDVGMFSITY